MGPPQQENVAHNRVRNAAKTGDARYGNRFNRRNPALLFGLFGRIAVGRLAAGPAVGGNSRTPLPPATQPGRQVYTACLRVKRTVADLLPDAMKCWPLQPEPHAMTAMNPLEFATLRSSLYTAVVADVLDALGFRQQAIGVPLPRVSGQGLLIGRAKTTLWDEIDQQDPRPYELELKAVDECQTDDVLIAAAAGSMRSGIWGELLSTAARNRGCAGVLIDGAVRDVAQMNEMGFLVFARGTCPLDSLHRQRVTAVDVPVEIGGVTIAPGDLVLADLDGAVVVPQSVESEALAAAWKKVHAENQVRDEIRAGSKAGEVFKKYGVL